MSKTLDSTKLIPEDSPFAKFRGENILQADGFRCPECKSHTQYEYNENNEESNIWRGKSKFDYNDDGDPCYRWVEIVICSCGTMFWYMNGT